MIILYESMTTNFNNNGLGVLSDVISCEVTEERNGLFELELEHPFDLRDKWKNLIEDNIIKAPTPTGEQLFRIYRKYKSMSGIRVFARHIFYDLIDNFLEDCRPENTDGTDALSRILFSTQYPHKFTSISDVPGLKTAYFVRKNPVEAIFSEDGVLGIWGGELERDNFLIKLLQNRGRDRGVTIRYGKNLLGIEEDLDLDTVITRLMPQGYDGLFLPEKYIDSTFINNYPHPKIRKIEYSDIKVDEENGITEAMAITQLRERAQKEFSVNKVDIPAANYKVDFIELSKTEEYKNYAVLERVYLCDTVTIKHLKLGFDLKAKVIKYKYNCLTNRYIEIELGAFKESMVNALNTLTSLKGTVDNLLQNAVTGTKMQIAIDHATELLTGALGGYVVFRPKEKPTEILIMDTDDMLTAQRVWRWNLNGLGYSNKGVNGPYETAMTMDGFIIGKFIEAYSITTNQVSSDFGQKLDLSSNTSIGLKVNNAIDGIQIGGTNLLERSDTDEFKKSIDETSPTYNQFIQFDITHVDDKINVGDIVTISFDVQMTTGTILKIYDTNNNRNKRFGGKDWYNIGNKRVRLSWTTTVTSDGKGSSWHSLDFYTNNNGDKFIIEKIKIEKGNKTTDYSLAPEDVQAEINRVNGLVTDITTDGLVTPLEKRSLKKEWDTIVAEKPTIEAQATINVISSTDQSLVTSATLTTERTAYTNAYNVLNTELTPILADLTVNSSVNSATLRTKFKDYYSAKELLLKAIIDKLNANTRVVADRFKQAELKITKEAITSTVSDTYTTKTEFTNLQVGTRNLVLKSNEYYSNMDYNIANYKLSEPLISGKVYTVTLKGMLGTGKSYFGIWFDNGTKLARPLLDNGNGIYSVTFTMIPCTDMQTINIFTVLSTTVVTSTIEWIKLEEGNKSTGFSLAPEDVNSKITGLTFTNIANVVVSGDTVTSVSGADNVWDKTCNSIEKLGNGQYLEFTAGETSVHKMIGLNITNSLATYADIDFAWYLVGGGTLQIYEEGSKVSDEGFFVVGDVFRIAVEGGKVNYYQNGELKHTSTRTPTLPLFVDMSFYNKGGKITGIKIGTMLSGVAEKLVSHESRIYSAEQKITKEAIISTVSETIDTKVSDPRTAVKLNGTELLNLSYMRDSATLDMPFAYGFYNIAPPTEISGGNANEQNLIKTVNGQSLYTPYVPCNPNDAQYCKLSVYNLTTNTGTVYVQCCYYDKNKSAITTNEGAISLIGGVSNTSANTWNTFEGYINPLPSTDIRQKAVYMRIRILTRYSGQTGTTYLKDLSWKQLSPQTSSYAQSKIEQLSDQITSKVDVNGVKSTIEQNPASIKIGFNKINTNIQTDEGGILAIKNGALKVFNTRGNAYLLTGYNVNGDSYVYTQGYFQAGNESGRTLVYPDGTTAVNGSSASLSPWGLAHENRDGRNMFIKSSTNLNFINLSNVMDRAFNLFELNGSTIRTHLYEGKRAEMWQNTVNAAGTTDKNLWLNKTAGDQVVVGNGANTGWGHLSAGSLYVSGSKNCIQETENYGWREMYAVESPEYHYTEFGKGKLVDGKCVIWIEDIFGETVNTDMDYHVFVSPYGRGYVWTSERTPNYFIVEGDNDIEFSWQFVAKRKGFETVRLEVAKVEPKADADFKVDEEDQRDMNVVTVTDYYLNEMNSGVFTNSEMNFNELEQNNDLTLSEFNYNSDNLLDEYDKYLMEGLM